MKNTDARIGVITTDPIRIMEELQSIGAEPMMVYGGKPGEKSCIFTLGKVEPYHQDWVQRQEHTTGFSALGNEFECAQYLEIQYAEKARQSE